VGVETRVGELSWIKRRLTVDFTARPVARDPDSLSLISFVDVRPVAELGMSG